MNITEATSLFSEAQVAPVSYVDLSLVTDRVPIDMGTRQVKFPAGVQRLGVQYDHLAERVTFEVDRYVDGVDLAQHTIAVQWTNGENGGIYPVTEIDLGTDDKILFNWTISGNMTQHATALAFSVHFYSILDGQFTYSLYTVPASKEITAGLATGGQEVGNIAPDEIDVYIQRMSDLNKEIAATMQQIAAKAAEVSGMADAAAESAHASAESEQASSSSSDAAARSAQAAATSAQEARNSADAITAQASLAQSYAVGGTGNRPGEDTDNAKYYMEQAREITGTEEITSAEIDQAFTAVV